ncbi:MAG: filamentous hemagglutinin N-terminal domain-containing protein [Rhodocyclaceae bacterium]|nr:filamentous hemagglutinin N-terminal domain-containing protein [Rhodocyclaceae bacterium]
MYKHATVNKAFRLKWSDARSAWVAVAEFVRSSGKRASTTVSHGLLLGVVAFSASMSASAQVPISTTLPNGATIVAGQVAITTSASRMDVNQSSAKAIVNWNSFNIGSGAQVNFAQPNNTSVILNRVEGGNASQIFGRLTSNGHVFLTNPAGVLFAPGAQVDVGGLVASTLGISDANFLAEKYSFSNGGSAAGVTNAGNITSSRGGFVALIAPQVSNSGNINAPSGSIGLAAGDHVNLDFDHDGLLSFRVDLAAAGARAGNSGSLVADGGRVVMNAQAKDALLSTVLNNDGVIRARSLGSRNGEIWLGGGASGVVSVTGTLDASGTAAGQSGGTVKVLGDKVGLFDHASVDVSGVGAGGTALIGGNWQGKGMEQNASATYVGKDVSINADAVGTGDGGKVLVWAEGTTQFYGKISARGGTQSGDGGFVEVSGKKSLVYAGLTDLRAPQGMSGTLLLDPDDVLIVNGAASDGSNLTCVDSGGGTGTCTDPDVNTNATGPFADSQTASGLNATITDGTINAQLGFGNVTVTATEGIDSASGVLVDQLVGGTTLNLTAGTFITLGGTYSGSGNLSLSFTTTLDVTRAPSLGGVTATATATGGNATITGTNATYLLHASTADAGSIAGVLSWTGIKNITDTGVANVNFNTGGSVTGALVSTTPTGTLNYGTYATDVTYKLGGTAGSTGITGSNTGFTTITGNSANSNTVTGSGATYLLDAAIADKGSNGGQTWTDFKNITDTGVANVNFNTGGSVTGALVSTTPTGTLNYGTYATDVTYKLGGTAGSTGITGSNTGFTTITGNSANSNTVTGSGATYLLDAAIADKGSNGGQTWTDFKNITDTGVANVNFNTGGSVTGALVSTTPTGTLNYGTYATDVTYKLGGTAGSTGITGSNTGFTTITGNSANSNTVTGSGATYLLDAAIADKGSNGGQTWTDFKNITDTGVANVNFNTGGSVTGALVSTTPTGTLNYGTYATDVTYKLGGTAGSTGITGSNTGFTTITGNSANSNTVTGSGATYLLDAAIADKGSNGGQTWTDFKNITDTGVANVNFNTGGSVTGALVSTTPTGTLNYGTYATDVTYKLGGTAGSTGITGSNTGFTTITGNSANSNTVTGSGATYLLDAAIADKGSNGGQTWTDFKNITDTGVANVNFNTGGSVTGALVSTTPTGTLNYGTYATDVTYKLGGTAGSTGITGSNTGFTTITGNSANSNTVTGSGATYLLDAAIADKGSNGGQTWTDFKNITDTGVANVNFNTGGSVTGALVSTTPTGTLNYGTYATDVTYKLGGTAGEHRHHGQQHGFHHHHWQQCELEHGHR